VLVGGVRGALADLVDLVDGDACWAEVPHVGGEGHEALERADFAPKVAVAAGRRAPQLLSAVGILGRNT
jgi:hypothetical protein